MSDYLENKNYDPKGMGTYAALSRHILKDGMTVTVWTIWTTCGNRYIGRVEERRYDKFNARWYWFDDRLPRHRKQEMTLQRCFEEFNVKMWAIPRDNDYFDYLGATLGPISVSKFWD